VRTLTALELPTGVGACSQAEKACQLPTVAELASIDFAGHDRRTRRTDAIQYQELEALLPGLLARLSSSSAALICCCTSASRAISLATSWARRGGRGRSSPVTNLLTCSVL
jgi:hypothetical protein